MKSEYESLLSRAEECEVLSKNARDKSIREKSAELAEEYRSLAECIRRLERPARLSKALH
jgi:hypothetical protein